MDKLLSPKLDLHAAAETRENPLMNTKDKLGKTGPLQFRRADIPLTKTDHQAVAWTFRIEAEETVPQ